MARHFTSGIVPNPCVGKYTSWQTLGGKEGGFDYFDFDKKSNPDKKTKRVGKIKLAVFDTTCFRITGVKFVGGKPVGSCFSNVGSSPKTPLKVFWDSNKTKTVIGHGKWSDIKTKVLEKSFDEAKFTKVLLAYDITEMPKGGNPSEYPMVQLEFYKSGFMGWDLTFEAHASVIGSNDITIKSERDIATADEKGFSLILSWDSTQIVPPTGSMTYCFPYFKAIFTSDQRFRESDKKGVADTDAWIISEAKKAEFDFDLDDAVAAPSPTPSPETPVAFPVPANQQTMANVPDDDLPF